MIRGIQYITQKLPLFSAVILAVFSIGFGAVILSKNQPDNGAPIISHAVVSDQSEQISVIVVPHFDFAKDLREKLTSQLAQKISPAKIIIVSVNHYNAGTNDIISTDKNWNFSTSQPKINQRLFDQITADKSVVSDEPAFLNEHGIYNIFPDLSVKFPSALFLPIIIKDTTSRSRIDLLLDELYVDCPDCLLVASIDFSHYNPNSLTQIHDQMSLSALANRDVNLAWRAETDSPQSLYLTTSWATKTGVNQFHLFDHNNSGEATGNDDVENTSYVLGYYSNSAENTSAHVQSTTFLFGGDLMFDRGVNHTFKDVGLEHVFDQLGRRVFWGSDIAMANLEGPISDSSIDDNIEPNNLKFNFPPESIKALEFLGVNALSLGNNHSQNAGQAGLATTKQLLSSAGISPIGQGNAFNTESVRRFETGVPTSVIAVNMLNHPNEISITDAISHEHRDDRFVIIFPHWGVEYQPKHSAGQERLARAWIEAGADMVVGSHPHVVQDMVIYKDKPIIYSLGNFVFDQNFSEATQVGLLIGGIITDETIQLSFFPMSLKNIKPVLMTGQSKSNIIKQMFDISAENGFTKIRSDTISINR